MSINIADKQLCCGCEACVQICNHQAISMQEDEEGFRYPHIDSHSCVECGLCEKVCQYIHPVAKYEEPQSAFGGYITDKSILLESTSGGAFTAIVNTWCDNDYVIFGAEAEGLEVYHSYITDKQELSKFRRSKYSQSVIGSAYHDAQRFLMSGKKVLFSGTPCQIAGLKAYLSGRTYDHLLTVEVICEGVPSPLFVRKYEEKIRKKYGCGITALDYRYKDGNRWDYEVMLTSLNHPKGKTIKCDRWLNPFWSIWLNHLMSRPACYKCLYTTTNRIADITLGDLWGVHHCFPDLYNSNKGTSLVITNTAKGERLVRSMMNDLFQGREIKISDAMKYQGPMRKPIAENTNRKEFLADLKDLDYDNICKKWAKPSSIKLLISKYVWGTNRQKVIWWKIKHLISKY